MAIDTIKFKRGVKSKLNNLSYGEPAYISDENELYIGTEDGVEKITRNKEVAELSSQLEHKANSNDLIIERKRIDQLIKIEGGQTEGNAELLDIRVGDDGKEYDNAGNSVRFQIRSIKQALPHLKPNLAYFELSEMLNPSYEGNSVTAINSFTDFITLKQGNYLFYISGTINITNFTGAHITPGLNTAPVTLCTSNTSYTLDLNTGDFESYGFMNLSKDTTARVMAYFSNQNVSIVNNYNVTAKKIFVLSMDEFDFKYIEMCRMLDNSMSVMKKVFVFDDDLENYYTKSEIDVLVEKTKFINCYGDSLTQGSGGNGVTYPNELQNLLGDEYIVRNLGVGGESTKEIMVRQGALSIILNNITIPKQGDVVIGDSDIGLLCSDGTTVKPFINGYGGDRPFFINNKEVNFYYNAYNDKKYRISFKNNENEDMIIDRPTALITDNAKNHKHEPVIIWMGQNGGYVDGVDDVENWIRQYKMMVDYSGTDKYLIIGRTSLGASDKSVEERFKNAFGNKYLNLREYLVDYGLLDVNLTPTEDDLTAIEIGKVPPSLLNSDMVHFTDKGYKSVAKAIKQKLIDLCYI